MERFDTAFFAYPAGASLSPPREEIEFMRDASDEDLLKVLTSMQTRRFGPGETVLRPDEGGRAFYLLIDGTLRIAPRDGRPILMAPPALFGEIGFLGANERSAAVIAETHGEVLRMSFEAFEALAARHPRLGRDVLLELGQVVAARLAAAESLSRPG